MPDFRHSIRRLLSGKRLFCYRLLAFCLTGGLLLAATASYYDSGRRRVVVDTAPELSTEQLAKKPNVIVVLSEAFWDPTLLPGVKFSRDPIPYFHALAAKYSSGYLLSPEFGGLTANVEFEVLTGNSTRFLSTDVTVYEKYVKTNIDSLAGILHGQGYTATAISPTDNWFANSREAYKRFGFSRFISLEYFHPNEYVGPYIGDQAVARRIIEESGKSDGPDMIFANTMENHYHFYPGKFRRNTIEVTADMPSGDIGILETYAQGISGADRMLETLVTHFSQKQEPTVIVFFGDHLPFFEDNYLVYRDAKYITGEDDPDFLTKLYSTPVLVWDNFSTRPKDTLRISPSFLGPYVLHRAGLPGTDYTDYLYALSERVPMIPPEPYYAKMNVPQADVNEYAARQRLMMAGQLTDQQERSLTMGYGAPAIRSVSPSALVAGDTFRSEAGRSVLSVQGGPFGTGSRLYWNGQPLQTEWQNAETINVAVPKELYSEVGQVRLDVRIVDKKDTVLGQSEPYRLDIRTKP